MKTNMRVDAILTVIQSYVSFGLALCSLSESGDGLTPTVNFDLMSNILRNIAVSEHIQVSRFDVVVVESIQAQHICEDLDTLAAQCTSFSEDPNLHKNLRVLNDRLMDILTRLDIFTRTLVISRGRAVVDTLGGV